jgi:hypothetical protein
MPNNLKINYSPIQNLITPHVAIIGITINGVSIPSHVHIGIIINDCLFGVNAIMKPLSQAFPKRSNRQL